MEACIGVTVDFGGACERGCAGEVLTGCDDFRVRVDCGRFGLECDAGDGCFEIPPTGEPCSYDTYEPQCQDGRPHYCGGSDDIKAGKQVMVGPLCSDHGLMCAVDPTREAALCQGTEGACEGSYGPTSLGPEGLACAGDLLTACVNGGQRTIDCGAVAPGFGCQTATHEGGRMVFFCGLGDACLADSEVDCDGSTVVFCNMGRTDRFDCADLGFTGCSAPWGCTPGFFSN